MPNNHDHAVDHTQIAQHLVDWHRHNQRPLPWRDAPAGRRNAYAVWISEVMAQQTRLETVVGYFERWMARFPTVEALAAADLQEVLKLWEGLGYYARARNLHRAAQLVVKRHDGLIPADRRELLALPGIGEYTAGAILSLAFGQAQPILDGNVKRVLTRLSDLDQPIDQRETLKRLWSMARRVVEAAPPGTAGACNEALMEFGATLCTPRNPRCLICPLKANCRAAASGTQGQRPVMPARRAVPHYDVAAGIIWQGRPYRSPILIAQRPHEGMLGGLWEFPGGKMEPADADLAACLRREIAEEMAVEIEVGEQIATLRHAFTHFRITLHAFHARHLRGKPQTIGCADWRWIDLAGIDAFPFPVTDQKIIRALRREAPHHNGTG